MGHPGLLWDLLPRNKNNSKDNGVLGWSNSIHPTHRKVRDGWDTRAFVAGPVLRGVPREM
jgi:hypothetical protein